MRQESGRSSQCPITKQSMDSEEIDPRNMVIFKDVYVLLLSILLLMLVCRCLEAVKNHNQINLSLSQLNDKCPVSLKLTPMKTGYTHLNKCSSTPWSERCVLYDPCVNVLPVVCLYIVLPLVEVTLSDLLSVLVRSACLMAAGLEVGGVAVEASRHEAHH